MEEVRGSNPLSSTTSFTLRSLSKNRFGRDLSFPGAAGERQDFKPTGEIMSNQTPQDPYLTNQPIPPHLQQHNVVGGSPLAPKPTVKPGSPPTKAERASAEADWKARWEATKGQATTWIPNPPTAWKSIPSGVRFAVWVWAISVIVSVAGAALFAILMVLGVVAVLGGQS